MHAMHDYLPSFLTPLVDSLTWVDMVLIGVLLVSTLWGWARGMIQELLGLVGWGLAFWGARLGTPLLVSHLTFIQQDMLRWGVAFVGLMLFILITVKLLSILLQKMVARIGLKALDGFLGAGFGLLRGALLDVVLLLLAGLTPLPHEPEWTQARIVPLAMRAVTPVLHWLPNHLSQLFHY